MKAFGITHTGTVRKENQDYIRWELTDSGEALTAVLCDGMGGAQSGAVASAMAADTFMSHAANSLDERSSPHDMKQILTEAVSYANIKVYDRSFRDFSCMGMGSTLVALLANPRRCLIGNVGDSRAYIIHKGRIQQISRDHSLVEDMLARGEITAEQARCHPQKNIITRAIGVEASVRCDIFDVKLSAGDRILLCSDGLSNAVEDEEILDHCNKYAEPEEICRSLLDFVLERGASDNVSILVADK